MSDMFDFIYSTSFLISLTSLILWFYFASNSKVSKLMRLIFFTAIIIYFLTVLLSPSLFGVKLFALARDLIVMGAIAQLFRVFKDSKFTFFILLAVMIGTFKFKGQSYMVQTFDETNEQMEVKPNLENTEDSFIDPKNELLIELAPNTKPEVLNTITTKYNLTLTRAFYPDRADQTDLDDYYSLNIPEEFEPELETIITSLANHPSVDAVELNELFRINPIIDIISPPARNKFGINDPGINQLWGFETLEMDKLYQVLNQNNVTPKKKAKVFIVDSGVDASHEDLKDRYRSVNPDYDKDTNGHGTHCAGIATAITNNNIGIASVFPSNDFAEVSGIKVINFLGLITQQRLIEGIIEAIDQGADVISVSIGARSREAAQEAFQEAVEYADQANAIIVVAAGNSNENAQNFTPANADGVITVSAIDTFSNKASFSNMVGSLKMGVAAPGVKIYSTYPKSKYQILSGTSMACPQVSGLVGLMKSINPDLTSREAFDILNSTGKETGDTNLTGKLINPAKAIERLLAK